MGFSWSMSGVVTLPTAAVAAFRVARVDPARYRDWPREWGFDDEAFDDDEPIVMTVDEVLAVYRHAFAHDLAWTGGELRLRAVFSDDSDCWLTYRSELAAAIRAAADHGGSGELAITGALDGGPEYVFRIVARAGGTSRHEVVTARRAQPIAKRVEADVEPLIEAKLAELRAAEAKPRAMSPAPMLDPKLAAATFAKLVAKTRLTGRDREAAEQLMALLPEVTILRIRAPFTRSLVAASERHAGTLGRGALAVLAAWRHPGVAARIAEAAGGALPVDSACALLETLRDRRVVPALRKKLAALPANAPGDRDRLAQCIAHLAGR
jgi:hypothetical protein|nr:hypothetical protein [Kofleriaceae bacterium]